MGHPQEQYFPTPEMMAKRSHMTNTDGEPILSIPVMGSAEANANRRATSALAAGQPNFEIYQSGRPPVQTVDGIPYQQNAPVDNRVTAPIKVTPAQTPEEKRASIDPAYAGYLESIKRIQQ